MEIRIFSSLTPFHVYELDLKDSIQMVDFPLLSVLCFSC